MANIIQNVFDLVGYFTDVALTSPVSAVLMLTGFLLVGVSSLVFGYLALGAAVDFILPESVGRTPPQQG